MVRVLISCPVLRREWIIRRYLEHAAVAAECAGVEFSFLMLGRIDDPTFAVVDDLRAFDVERIYVEEDRDVDKRDWSNKARFHRLAEIRNRILGQVRLMTGIDYLLSVDSDILLHPQCIANLIETQHERGWAAVGGYCYLSTSRSHPSYAHINGKALRRPDMKGSVQRCDVLMAIKLMTPAAWMVDYAWNTQGEDIGWSLNAKERGLELGCDARVVNRHVMRPTDLDRNDPRCD